MQYTRGTITVPLVYFAEEQQMIEWNTDTPTNHNKSRPEVDDAYP